MQQYSSSHDTEATSLPDSSVEAGTGQSYGERLRRNRATATTNEPTSNSSVDLARMLWLFLLVCFFFVVAWIGPKLVERYQYAITRGQQQAQLDVAREALKDSPLGQLSVYYQMVSQRVGPSVVHISTVTRTDAADSDDPAPFFHPRSDEGSGQGSGVVVDAEGYIVTNYHVIEGSTEIEVTLTDHRRVTGQVVGFDRLTDLAVLKVEADGLEPATWGDSDQLQVGSLVWAVGSPFGLQQSITAGILSAKNRAGSAGTVYQNFLQTDAAVNPGNSGGPLVNEHGEIIGVNTAIVGQTYQGISFAIPSNVARRVFESIRDEGRVERGWLGVQMEPITVEEAKAAGWSEGYGVRVVDLPEFAGLPSPARVAGIRLDDIIIRWNESIIDSPAELSNQVAQTKIGSTAKIMVFRNGQQLSFEIKVGRRPTERR